MAAPFKRQQVADRDLQFVQNNVAAALAPLQALPMAGGNVVAGVVLSTSQVAVPHGLDHVPQYFAILDLTTAATVYRTAASDSRFIYLTATAACTVSLWVN